MSAPPAVRCACERVDVLCSCGWGRLSVPVCTVPEFCPLCGFDFWAYGGIPDTCPAEREERP